MKEQKQKLKEEELLETIVWLLPELHFSSVIGRYRDNEEITDYKAMACKIKDIINLRKIKRQACQEMIEYMEKNREQMCKTQAESAEALDGALDAIEAAKEYLKTL